MKRTACGTASMKRLALESGTRRQKSPCGALRERYVLFCEGGSDAPRALLMKRGIEVLFDNPGLQGRGPMMHATSSAGGDRRLRPAG